MGHFGGVGGQNRGFLVDFEGGGPSINWQYQGRGKKVGLRWWGVFDGGGVDKKWCGGHVMGGGNHNFGWWWR